MEEPQVTCLRALVQGRVQRVGFRYHAQVKARELRVAGWIKNLHDGRVETWLEGRPDAVEAMLAWLRQGPPHAQVERVETLPEAPEHRLGFEILR